MAARATLHRFTATTARSMQRGITRQFITTTTWSHTVPQLRTSPVRMLCSSTDLSKATLIECFNAIGEEARKVMFQSEDGIRREVDSKLKGGMDMELAASMYGHQMAQYMAEFLPLPNKPDSVVQRIRSAVLTTKGVSDEALEETMKKYDKDHEVQLVLSTMYQHRLDDKVLPDTITLDKYCELTAELSRISIDSIEKINANINSKASAYMTDNQRNELEGARQAVPTIAVFTAQYQALNEAGVSYQDKLLADLMFAVWPRAQQANAQLQQAIQDAQQKFATKLP